MSNFAFDNLTIAKSQVVKLFIQFLNSKNVKFLFK